MADYGEKEEWKIEIMSNLNFREKLSPYLWNRIRELIALHGKDSKEVTALTLQYKKEEREETVEAKERQRHYESDLLFTFKGNKLRFIERLYKRSLVIEITMVCVANCRWCLRRNYSLGSLKEKELLNIAKYCGSKSVKDDLSEILITGGDPFMIPDRLNILIDAIVEFAPNIKIVRIGSKLPVQDPQRINDHLIWILRKRENLKIELGTHINHPVELSEEAIQAYKKIIANDITIYDQTILLKGINDNLDTLIDLYDHLRYLGIESHYLFHCIPIKGMNHHRTSIKKGLELIRALTSCGKLSGRSKPMFTAMTDIGKITLYDGVIKDQDKSKNILLKSHYLYEERKKWNPSWKLPDSAQVDEDGFMSVWYLDGTDE